MDSLLYMPLYPMRGTYSSQPVCIACQMNTTVSSFTRLMVKQYTKRRLSRNYKELGTYSIVTHCKPPLGWHKLVNIHGRALWHLLLNAGTITSS